MSLPVNCLKSDATAPSSRKPTLRLPAMLAGSPPTVIGTLRTCSRPIAREDGMMTSGAPPSAARTDGSADAVSRSIASGPASARTRASPSVTMTRLEPESICWYSAASG